MIKRISEDEFDHFFNKVHGNNINSFCVYFIQEQGGNNCIKIGKGFINEYNVLTRLSGLQVSNSNELKIVKIIKCKSEEEAFFLEKELHKKFEKRNVRGEWFNIDYETICALPSSTDKEERRTPIKTDNIFDLPTLGFVKNSEVIVGINNHPRCFFYPDLCAQILTNYEKSLKRKNPYRTMEYPTHGKSMIKPYSRVTNVVFISGKKHEQNLELKRYQNSKGTLPSDMFQEPNPLDLLINDK